MERLWAPWRLQYVTVADKVKKDECLFCSKYASKEDVENQVLYKTEHSFSLLNIFPYNNGHLMVAPKRHVADIEELTDEELLDCMQLVKKMKKVLQRVVNPHGFNIGINCGAVAGAGIADHLHIHIVPRWNGDTNFMPVLSDTRVIPQSLEALHELLMEEIDATS